MSVATEFAPVVFIPEQARTERPSATILTLRRPSEASVAPPLRLTRRGIVVLGLAVAALAVAIVSLAALSAPTTASGRQSVPASVTVHDGDTLWSIATRVAPDTDPRAEVATLQRLNHLHDVALTPGQALRTR
jgi:nucleoid-associated protein YgaU